MSAPDRDQPPRIGRPAAELMAQGARGLRVEQVEWESVAERSPQALGVTFWFEPDAAGLSGPVTIRFTGRRVSGNGKRGPRDRFTTDEVLDVIASSGPVAVTTRVRDINPGTWQATATVLPTPSRASRSRPPRPKLSTTSASGTTAYAPVIQVRAPGAHLGAWPTLVGAGAVVALAMQGLLARHLHLPVVRVLTVSLVAALVGLVGAKSYYAIGHYVTGERSVRELLSGACIQGFVLGAGAALAVGTQLARLPVGTVLDATTPGLLFGMTIGRYGCFFGGCCVGRPTASRWGLWSSDRRVGIRRVPVQLFESTGALGIGLLALIAVWNAPVGHAQVFVGGLAAYTLARQLLFPLRAISRHTNHGRVFTLVASCAILVADTVIAVVLR